MAVTIDLSGQTAWITGAASGIGLATSRALADAGARVLGLDVAEGAAPEGVESRALDVRDTAAVAQLVREVDAPDILVNAAGITRDAVVWRLDDEAWDAVIDAEPALAAALSFRAALIRAGISVAGRAMTGTADAAAVPLGSTESVPLVQILRFMDHESDNFTAEILLKQLGAGFGTQGTTAAGAEVVHQLLGEQEVPLAGVRIVDGSGLSRLDRLTVASVVGMLQSSWLDQNLREILISSLPVAGRSGTLRRRMRGTVAAGRVRGKTGTLSVASALSGYAKRKYAFSVIQNGSPVSHYWARRAQDRFAAVLASH